MTRVLHSAGSRTPIQARRGRQQRDVMLRSGMVVRTRDGRIVMLKGRNACNLSIWWGWLVKDGNRQGLKPDKNTMAMLLAEDVVAVKFGKGQGVFWGVFEMTQQSRGMP